MKYLDPNVNKNINEKTTTTHFFDKTGADVIDQREFSYAKVIQSKIKETYYVRVYEGRPLDPWGMYKGREKTLSTKLKKVSKATFDYYMLFLKTRNSLYMTRAQRSFLND
jgi:hypothetical protein|tara:strand:+ start:3342 stop:3671 length:330 start_codon:yes stop_codon:yes gene_type:complete